MKAKLAIVLAAINPFKMTGNVIVDGLYLGMVVSVVVIGCLFAYYW